MVDVTLKVMAGGSSGFATRTISLPGLIGRQSGGTGTFPTSSNAIFSNSLVSRKHAEMRLESYGQVILEDLGSSNGTFLNGEQITPRIPYRLNNGDIIQFGSEDEDLDLGHSSSRNIHHEEALVVQLLLATAAGDTKKPVFSPGRLLYDAKKILGKSVDISRAASSTLSSSFSGYSNFDLVENHKIRESQQEIRYKRQNLQTRLELLSSKLSKIHGEVEMEDALKLDYIEDMLNSFDFGFSHYFCHQRITLNPDDAQTIHHRLSLNESIRIIVCIACHYGLFKSFLESL